LLVRATEPETLSEQLLGDDHPLDLVGALIDLGSPLTGFPQWLQVRLLTLILVSVSTSQLSFFKL
jgi:hypothetical protein